MPGQGVKLNRECYIQVGHICHIKLPVYCLLPTGQYATHSQLPTHHKVFVSNGLHFLLVTDDGNGHTLVINYANKAMY